MLRLLAALAAFALLLPAAAAAAARPNIVVVETDDQRTDELAWMPATQRLIVHQGVVFPNSIVSESQCCPSRATFQTGEYAHNHRVLDTTPPFGGFTAFRPRESIGVWLQRAGYTTALVGKYFNGYARLPAQRRYVPPGWSQWHALLGPTIYRFFGFRTNDNGVIHRHPGAYETDTLTGIAERFVRSRAHVAKPFFLWLTYVAPHVGGPTGLAQVPAQGATVPSPIFENLFFGGQMPLSPAFGEADVADKPRGIRRRPRIGPIEAQRIQNAWLRRQQSLASVDEGVVRVMRALRAAHKLRNTLVVFTSDNGFLLGEHRVRSGKVLPYEPSIEVPLAIRGPGVPRGATSRELVWNGDLAPTLLQAAGGRAAWPPDGESLWPFLRHPRRVVPRAVELESPPLGRTNPTPQYTGVRTDRYTYVEWTFTGEQELYDLRRDPFELRNLAGTPGARAVQARLAATLRRLRSCIGRSCRQPAATRRARSR
jgi:arylsulfatase A-like enzyme